MSIGGGYHFSGKLQPKISKILFFMLVLRLMNSYH